MRIIFYEIVFRNICQLLDREFHGVLGLLEEPQVQNDLSYLSRVEQCCAGHSHCLAADATLPQNSFQYVNLSQSEKLYLYQIFSEYVIMLEVSLIIFQIL